MSRCITPVSIVRPNGKGPADRIDVPCGKCITCLSNRRNDWSFRLEQELKCSDYSFFVTLTYSDDNLPKQPVTGHPIVSKRDCQLFLKRLRECERGVKWRYFLVSEYGPTTLRPHYHVIFFASCERSESVYRAIRSYLIESWQLGYVHIGNVTPSSITYCAKYCLGKNDPEYSHLEPVFSLMSRKPGIGSNYLKTHKEWHTFGDPKLYVINSSNYKMRLPRFYRDRMFEFELPTQHYVFPPSPFSPQETILRAMAYAERLKQRNKTKAKI